MIAYNESVEIFLGDALHFHVEQTLVKAIHDLSTSTSILGWIRQNDLHPFWGG